ncbi:uncharacterized protein [Triticum aestivum]|uniref:uncharacterized protein n=1 Tax=Triticum aestivum TaxID=4565 RepID=UPI001D01F98E|nr:uncharacterized protein LOC123090608 [Triticum aestivum]
MGLGSGIPPGWLAGLCRLVSAYASKYGPGYTYGRTCLAHRPASAPLLILAVGLRRPPLVCSWRRHTQPPLQRCACEATAGALVLFHYGGQSAKPPGSGVIFHSGGQISSSLGNTRSSEDAVLVHGSGREKSFSSLFPSMLLLIASLVMYKLCCCSSCPWQPRILLREELFPVRVVAALVYKCYFM